MSYVKANGADVMTATIHVPRIGVWHADLSIDRSDLRLFGEGAPVALSAADGAIQWRGTVRKSGLTRGTLFARIVGGGAGLNQTLRAQAYQTTTLRIPLLDILTLAGEKLSPKADTAVLGKVFNRWARGNTTAGQSIASLVESAGPDVSWRVQRDGTFWIGRELWTPNPLKYDLISDEPTLNRFRFASSGPPDIQPGQSLIDGRHVSYVQHSFDARLLRTTVWVEA